MDIEKLKQQIGNISEIRSSGDSDSAELETFASDTVDPLAHAPWNSKCSPTAAGPGFFESDQAKEWAANALAAIDNCVADCINQRLRSSTPEQYRESLFHMYAHLSNELLELLELLDQGSSDDFLVEVQNFMRVTKTASLMRSVLKIFLEMEE